MDIIFLEHHPIPMFSLWVEDQVFSWRKSSSTSRWYPSTGGVRASNTRAVGVPHRFFDGEERDVPEHMMVEGFRWSIGSASKR